MFPRCDNDNKSTGPLEAEVIPVLHSVAEANASDESDGVAKQEDEQLMNVHCAPNHFLLNEIWKYI